MNVEYLVLGIILAVALYLFWTQKQRTDVTALLVMLALILPWPHPNGHWRGILTYQEGFSGFGSPAVVMVTSMFVLGAAMVRTGAAERLGGKLFRACAGSEIFLQAAVLLVTTIFSMFVNDTTVVLIFLPIVLAICKERNLSPSRYLLCVAYGSLLGGQWTLIGTRSNIILSDYLRQRTDSGIGFFDFSPIAAAVFGAAFVSFLLFGRRFLPKAAEAESAEDTLGREYLTEVLVTPHSATVGKSLDQLGWWQRSDLTVVELIRGNERIPATNWLKLQSGDILVMQGSVPTIGDLLKSPDFQLKEEVKMDDQALRSVDLLTVEALLSPNSDYLGNTLEQVDFSHDYGFTVMGISRHGKTVRERPMATPLRYGDSLLLLGHVSGLGKLERNPNLFLVGHRHFPALGKKKAVATMLLMLGVVVAAVTNVLTPVISIPLVALLVLLLRYVKVKDAYQAVDWQAVVTVAGMIPFGLALEKTGAAEALARGAVVALEGFGPLAVLAALLLFALMLTQVIENAAAAIILAPVAFQLARETGADPKPFMVGLAICVSAAFCTPFAHESTILVMGPGRYRFKHYMQVGGVLALLTWLIASLLTPLVWPFGP
ncbi:MAG TPA: SLC13 family permease [Candidatus Paceibacterota bacterium]|nr:SLC13 family permease [Verrucomicrobiota bacterium]HSA10436.1 SLC13 family permease [Candidatus Paceibacterota bacterium]